MKKYLLIVLSITTFSCNQKSKQPDKASNQNIDTEFFIPVENSNLYVRLVGNADKPLIINLHGGPGGFSGFEHEFNRKHLEDDYLFAYLDQRGGGKSDTCTDSTMLTTQQFVKDLDVVVDTLQNRFKGKNINLIGGSWGGTLGLLYMIEHQKKINSFACVSGKADGIYPIKALIRHERQLAKELIENSKDSVAKDQYREILTKLKEIEESGFDQFFDDMNLVKHKFPEELGFNAYWANVENKKKVDSMIADTAVLKRVRYTQEDIEMVIEKMEFVNRVFRNTPSYNHLNIIDEIAVITKPVLVLQGEHDHAIGVEQGNMIYKGLKGVPEDKKELKIIPNAAHSLTLETEEPYFDAVTSFFDKYNN